MPARALIGPLIFLKIFRQSRPRTEGLSGHLRVYRATCAFSLFHQMGLSGRFPTCVFRALCEGNKFYSVSFYFSRVLVSLILIRRKNDISITIFALFFYVPYPRYGILKECFCHSEIYVMRGQKMSYMIVSRKFPARLLIGPVAL